MIRKPSRRISFLCTFGIYVLALAAAVLIYAALPFFSALLRAFAADAAATLIVWLAGVLLGNSSVYDPYWSVAPVVLVLFWALAAGGTSSLLTYLFAAALLVWGVRLTVNWARRWRGLSHQDWRYTMYRRNMPKLWPLINLIGINLMPTVLVFVAMIPVYKALASGGPANVLTLAGFAVCAFAILMELLADIQMDRYKSRPQPKNPYIAEGVWLWCRHPNYLGEVLFWWGVWLMQVSVVPAFWTAIGAALITLLFVFVSIPMMEKHMLESRPEYAEYIKMVPMILPIGILRKQPDRLEQSSQ